MQKDYKKVLPGYKKLMNAFADGINYYLIKHPAVKPDLCLNVSNPGIQL